MKKAMLMVAVLIVVPMAASAGTVRGHWKDTNHDGVKDTYVQPYERTAPNNTRTDNYDYPGNYNPNTGRNTPQSESPTLNYPSNPNPYEHKEKNPYGF